MTSIGYLRHGPDWDKVWQDQKGIEYDSEHHVFLYPCRCGFKAKSQGGRTRHSDAANFKDRLVK